MKRIVSLVCLICLLFSVNVFADTTVIIFSDVSNSHWAKSYIDTFVQNGVVSGYTDGTFKPENNVTREEFCKLLVKTFNADEDVIMLPYTQTFADVEPGRWSHKDVEICSKFLTGYINPFGGLPLFKPTDVATREDIAVALVKMLGYSEDDIYNYGSYVSKFKDSQEISPNLVNYVGFATSKGLINGYPDGTFGAQKGITRAETLVMLDRALKVSIDDEYENFEFDVKMSYRNNGQTVDIEVVSNYRLTATVNGEPLSLSEGAGYANKYARIYSYSFEEDGTKEFVVKAKHGNVEKSEVLVAEYHIGTPKIKITDCPEEVHTNNVKIGGKVTCDGAVYYDIDFTINDKKVTVNSNNEFYYSYTFEEEGIEKFVFRAEYKGKEVEVEREIEYSIYSPEIEIFTCPKEVSVNKATISGSISDKNYESNIWAYVSLMINDKKVNLDTRGLFTTDIVLEDGVNEIVFIAKNDKGKITKVRKTIEYIVEKEEVEEEVQEKENEEIKEEEEVKEYSAPILTIINYPETTEDSGIYISGQVIDKNVEDIRDILVSVNGDKAFVDDKGFWKDFVILNDGVNKIKVTATNEFGKTSEETIEIVKN